MLAKPLTAGMAADRVPPPPSAAPPLSPANQLEYDVILTFRPAIDDKGTTQLRGRSFCARGISEEGFVRDVLSSLEPELARSLIKISLCQMWGERDRPEPWLVPRQGKFYFNPDVNEDADTVRWDQFRNQFVSDAAQEKDRQDSPGAAGLT